MKNISVVVCVVFLTVLVVGLPNPESDGIRPGYCHIYGTYIKEGESVPAPIGECATLNCHDAEKNDISRAWCGLIAHKKECKLQGEDKTKQYPDCCARNICEDDN